MVRTVQRKSTYAVILCHFQVSTRHTYVRCETQCFLQSQIFPKCFKQSDTKAPLTFGTSGESEGHDGANGTEHLDADHGVHFARVGVGAEQLKDFASRHHDLLLFGAGEAAVHGHGDARGALQRQVVHVHGDETRDSCKENGKHCQIPQPSRQSVRPPPLVFVLLQASLQLTKGTFHATNEHCVCGCVCGRVSTTNCLHFHFKIRGFSQVA